jgi:dipeptidyl aminopeptidase/acylaminoacyl peptidase
VIWAGVVASYPDMLERWRRPNSTPATIPTRSRRWRQRLVEEYGTPAENPEFWASISANSYLSDLSGPIQLHHGDADTSVPIEFSELLEQQIQDASGEVEYYVYPGDEHNLSVNFGTAMQRSVAFFDTYLKDTP